MPVYKWSLSELEDPHTLPNKYARLSTSLDMEQWMNWTELKI